ncbi:MAG TPA: ActS/PrrB/RegB family redox-sensitive histidine kinase [Hyphomicrobiaceae bacterium]|nr:ActS/PrrB/RegB family redox-sensitive histidine kinase [Hyphomicrobiaceae bacterium]
MTIQESRLRLQTLIKLRWFGVAGQAATVLLVYFGLGYSLPIALCFVLIALSAWVNIYLRIKFPMRFRLGASLASALLACDIVGLAALLYLTGGVQNPFVFMLVAPVTVSAATLPPRNTIVLGLLAVVMAALLVEWHLPLPWGAGEAFVLPRVYKGGIFASVVSAMIFLGIYAARLTKEARQMTAALAATEHVLAREQRLHALDGLAAAAAHELGTPLSTIVLVTKELERETAGQPAIEEDIKLLRAQADRCREILRTLTRKPNEQDPHHASLPLTQLLQEAAEPYRKGVKRITIATAAAVDGPGAMREPIAERRPGLIYGLGNIIENAVDFASGEVTIDARWSDRNVEVRIADDGPGFAPGVIEALGEPYVTTRPQGQQQKQGSEAAGLGLGFFIAKSLLERSGAHLAFANRAAPATGAVVHVTWPRIAFDISQSKGAARPAGEIIAATAAA